MKAQEGQHLQRSQIQQAVIDENDLGTMARQHLRQCPVCRAAVAGFRQELQEFGDRTVQAVPPLSRPVRLPTDRVVRTAHAGGWLPFFGAAAMAGFVAFFYFMGLQTGPAVGPGPFPGQEGLLEDESLMREISEMVEYPLSEDLYEISEKSGNGFDDDFLHFVVPDTEEDYQSELTIQGGIRRC